MGTVCDGKYVTEEVKYTSFEYNGLGLKWDGKKCLESIGIKSLDKNATHVCWETKACDSLSLNDPSEMKQRYEMILIIGGAIASMGLLGFGLSKMCAD